jgi:pyroglutamyl-peptidase
MKIVLVTGFEPFGGEQVNPSALAAEALHGREIAGRRVAGTVLPCVFGKSLAILRREIQRRQPELIICTGQDGGRAEIAIESMAINLMNAPIPDNAGNQPIAQPVVETGPVAYGSTLPIQAIIAALRKARLPAAVSPCAGAFVCNYVFYGLMRTLGQSRTRRGGFIHVPYLPEQARRASNGSPAMPLKEMIRGLEIVIETSLTTQTPNNPGTFC